MKKVTSNLQFFNLFFKIGFMFLFDVGVGGILNLYEKNHSESYEIISKYERVTSHVYHQLHIGIFQ